VETTAKTSFYTDMRHLTTGIRSEKCVVRRFRRCANVIECEAVPLQAWSGPEGSRKVRFPDIMKMAQDGGKGVSLTHRPPLPPGNTPGTHFY
jgi:hypothetical protein